MSLLIREEIRKIVKEELKKMRFPIAISAKKLRGIPINRTAPLDAQVLTYLDSKKAWIPQDPAGGFVDPYYVLTKPYEELVNARFHPNTGTPDFNVKHEFADILGVISDAQHGQRGDLHAGLLPRDGTRPMTGKFQGKDAKFTLPNTSLEISEKLIGAYYYPHLHPTDSYGGNVVVLGAGVYCFDPVSHAPIVIMYGSSAGDIDPSKYGFLMYDYTGLYGYGDCLLIKSAGKLVVDLPTIPDLAGVGDAYVYVNANGKLTRGKEYP